MPQDGGGGDSTVPQDRGRRYHSAPGQVGEISQCPRIGDCCLLGGGVAQCPRIGDCGGGISHSVKT